MRFRIPALLLSMAAVVVVALVLVPADTAQTHGRSTANQDLAMDKSLAHWDDGEMDYKSGSNFPSTWTALFNGAASHMESETYATDIDLEPVCNL